MSLTKKQLDEVINIIDRHMLTFMATAVGEQHLTPDEIRKLKDLGLLRESVGKMVVDPAQYGRLVALLPEDVRKKLSKVDIEKMIRKLKPMTDTERAAIEYASNNIGEHIRGLKDSMLKDVRTVVSSQALQAVRDSVVTAIEERRTPSELKTMLFDKFDDRNRDWRRVASTELNDAIQFGIAAEIKRTSDEGADQLVYKRPNPDCFIVGTKIETRDGLVNIEDVLVGDYVLTHRLRWRRVKTKFKKFYSGKLYGLNSKPNMTANHPVLVNMNWVRADSIKAGDKIFNIGNVLDSNDQPVILSKKFLFGKMSAVASCIVPACASIYLYCNLQRRDSDVDIELTNSHFRNWIEVFKFIANLFCIFCHCTKSSLSRLSLFISSILCQCKNTSFPRICGESASLLFRQSFEPKSMRFGDAPFGNIVSNRCFFEERNSYSKFFGNGSDGEIKPSKVCDYDFILRKIFSIWHKRPFAKIVSVQTIDVCDYEGNVFNLEVEDDNSYVADGIAVHNCCPKCNSLYLESGIPKIFRLKDLAISNVGKKAANWLPTIGAVHPWCACQLHVLPEGFGFKKKNVVAQKFENGGKIFSIGQEISDSERAALSAENKTKIRQEAILEFEGERE